MDNLFLYIDNSSSILNYSIVKGANKILDRKNRRFVFYFHPIGVVKVAMRLPSIFLSRVYLRLFYLYPSNFLARENPSWTGFTSHKLLNVIKSLFLDFSEASWRRRSSYFQRTSRGTSLHSIIERALVRSEANIGRDLGWKVEIQVSRNIPSLSTEDSHNDRLTVTRPSLLYWLTVTRFCTDGRR